MIPPTKAKPRKRRYLTHEQLNAMPLHKLLAVGLADLRKQERTPGCEVNMEWWIDGNSRKCTACLAGSVLRHSIEKPFNEFSRALGWNWMHSLNNLRQGYVGHALRNMNRESPGQHPLSREIVDYHEDRTGWWKAMRRLHADLKKAGL